MDHLIEEYVGQRLAEVGVSEGSRLEKGAEVFLFELGDDFRRFGRRRDVFGSFGDFPKMVVVKKQRSSIPKTEFASWVSNDPAERLENDGYLARLVRSYARVHRQQYGEKMPLFDSVVPIVTDGGYYVQKIARGERLDRVKGGSTFFRMYNFVAALAIFHALMRPENVVGLPSVDHKKELEVICELNGWDFGKVRDVYSPFFAEFKNSVVAHNTLHWKNIFLAGKRNFVVLDWEVPALNVAQDDLVRSFEGPYGISDNQRNNLLCVYYAAESLAHNLTSWESKGFSMPIVSFEDKMRDPYFREFVYGYHMRSAVLNWWAFHHFKEQGKPNPGSRIGASFEALKKAAEIKNARNISKLERVLWHLS